MVIFFFFSNRTGIAVNPTTCFEKTLACLTLTERMVEDEEGEGLYDEKKKLKAVDVGYMMYSSSVIAGEVGRVRLSKPKGHPFFPSPAPSNLHRRYKTLYEKEREMSPVLCGYVHHDFYGEVWSRNLGSLAES